MTSSWARSNTAVGRRWRLSIVYQCQRFQTLSEYALRRVPSFRQVLYLACEEVHDRNRYGGTPSKPSHVDMPCRYGKIVFEVGSSPGVPRSTAIRVLCRAPVVNSCSIPVPTPRARPKSRAYSDSELDITSTSYRLTGRPLIALQRGSN